MAFFTLVPCWARAQVSVVLSLDREETTLSESVRMDLKVSGARSLDSSPVVEGLDSFQVSQGGSSSRVEIVNGRITQGVDYTYYIQPSKKGTFVIGPARVEVDGKVYESNTSTLKVLQSPRPRSGERGPVFLVASLSSKEAYVEEQVVYTLKLYLKTSVSDISLELPEQDHLVFRQLADPREYQGVYQGTRYRIIEVPYGLMALKEGRYAIAPSRMSMTAYDSGRRRRGFFDDPFFRMGRPVTIASQPLELKVMGLPDRGKPAGFSGLVGSFTIKASLSPAKLRVGESATLTVQIKGRGNVTRIPDLRIPELDHIKVYADQPVLESGKDSKGMIGVKIMKWALVPELQGDYEIPPLSLSFFDPRSGKYRTVKTPALPLVVIPGKGKMIMVKSGPVGKDGKSPPGKKGVKVLGHDILPLHTSVRDLGPTAVILSHGALLWSTLLAPFLLYLATFGPALEDRIGKGQFLGFYLLAGLVSMLVEVEVYRALHPEGPTVYVLGASGAIAGLLGLFAVRCWFLRVRVAHATFAYLRATSRAGVTAVPAGIAVAVWMLLQGVYGLVSLGNPTGGTAYWAHLSGLALGMGTGVAAGLFRQGLEERVLVRAHRYLDRGNWYAALGEYLTYREQAGETAEGRLGEARSLRLLQRTAEAREAYGRAVEILSEEERWTEAVEAAEEALRLGVGEGLRPAVLIALAEVVEGRGDRVRAAEFFERAGAMDAIPSRSAASLERAAEIARLHLGDLDRAARLFLAASSRLETLRREEEEPAETDRVLRLRRRERECRVILSRRMQRASAAV